MGMYSTQQSKMESDESSDSQNETKCKLSCGDSAPAALYRCSDNCWCLAPTKCHTGIHLKESTPEEQTCARAGPVPMHFFLLDMTIIVNYTFLLIYSKLVSYLIYMLLGSFLVSPKQNGDRPAFASNGTDRFSEAEATCCTDLGRPWREGGGRIGDLSDGFQRKTKTKHPHLPHKKDWWTSCWMNLSTKHF